ncbi:MAG: TonB-dependent receptor, partial [Paraglaciecola sp.]|nr:TonB-dependent receptor [Paraglaciecola sp.]
FEVGGRVVTATTYVDLRAFYLEKDQVILQDTQRQVINNGSTSHRGIELTFRQQLSPMWYIAAAGTYARHRYDSAMTISREDIAGNDIDTAPKQLGSAQLGWQSEQTQIELEWLTMGKYYLDPENTATYAGHELLNLRASTYLSPELKLSLRLLNLTNTYYAERADIAFGNYRYFVGEPRSVFVSLAYLFK